MKIGDKINNYLLTRALGEGGFGQVFLAEENLTGELRAIKGLRVSQKDQSDIIHEVQNISKLKLFNTVQYYHHFWEDDALYFVMEFCPGGNLHKKIGDKGYSIEQGIEWIKICSNSLSEVHKKGIAHKDIKPLNLLFDENGYLKIGDFGMANRNGGTRAYMSPGAIFGWVQKADDPREDIYSLGVTMLECLTGNNPFWGKSPQEIYEIHQGLRFQLEPLPEWIQLIILKAVNQIPELRFQTMAEFGEAIEAKQVPVIFKKEALEAGILAENVRRFVNQKKWIKAQTLVEHGLEVYPSNLKILQVAGDYFLARNKTEIARNIFETALKINPRINIQSQLGEIQLEHGNIPKAISLLSDHLHRNPNDLSAQNLLIKCFYLSERYQAAIDLGGELLKVFPNNPFFESNQYLCEALLQAETDYLTDSKLYSEETKNPFLAYNIKTLFGGYKDQSHALSQKPHVKSKLLFMESRFEFLSSSKSSLTIIDSNQKDQIGRKFMNKIILFGRYGWAANDIQIPDGTTISRRHSVIINQKDDIWLYDLGSAKGVKVNDYIVNQKIQLIGVSKIEIGRYWYRVTGDEGRLI